ncbi:MAG: alpha/beta hydrolase [Gammaproteobacteria bacterium]|nr:alpha/beta hydrolase [Gammaproteobacteria bacterium]
MNGIENGVLRHRLSSVHGFAAQPFNYQSVQAGLDENVLRLNQFLAAVPGDTLHLVGHSLGGLLLLHAQQRQPDPRPGRIVCLGSPLRGSCAAQALAALPFGEDMLGATIRDAVLNGGLDAWRGQREVGVIAGTLAAGLGRVIGELPEPNDGTVAVEETRLPGITEHLEMKVSHTGLLFDDDVAAQTAQFLRHGRFSHS